MTQTRRTFLAQSAATLALTHLAAASPAHLSPGKPSLLDVQAPAIPQPSPLGAVHLPPTSDLAHRTAQNFTRLQDPIYRPPLLFRQTNWQSWPGDFEGRALLADTLLARATGTPPPYLADMAAAYAAQLNPDGYFGPRLDLHAINEQQLSGHGWYLRALCEYHDYQATTLNQPAAAAETLTHIREIIRNLALPLRGHYATYPIDPELRARAAAPTNPGSVDGHLSGQHGDWAVSSDTGCAFIFLDGLTHAWVLLRAADAPEAPPLKALIDEAIARFAQVDLVAIKAQTHATLTALRAVIRIYEQTGDPTLLALVRDRYALYRTTGMTEHYANTNWFGRPESWTEPCAIIDSFMVATALWQHTANPAFLEDAHRIWFNGIGRGLRANGGFGTDTCPGHTPFVRVRSYEAYFCCTMRGGEGHARAAQYLYFTRSAAITSTHLVAKPDRSAPAIEITVPFFADSTVDLPITRSGSALPSTLSIRQTTAYPYTGDVTLEFTSVPATPITLRLFAPQWTANHRLTLNTHPVSHTPVPHTLDNGFLTLHLTPRPGDTLTLHQTLRVAPRDPITATTPAGSYAFEAGPLLLAYNPTPNPPANATLRSPDPTPITLPRNATLAPTATPGTYRVAATAAHPEILLSPINDLNTTPDPNPRLPHPRQLLFREA